MAWTGGFFYSDRILVLLSIMMTNLIVTSKKSKSLLVISAFLHFPPFATLCKPTTCEILFRETNPKRDKNGTKSQENKIKNASSPTSLVVDFSFLCKGTILSREKQAKSSKYAAYQTFILHVHFQEDTASASCTDLCCLLQRPVKIRFIPFVHCSKAMRIGGNTVVYKWHKTDFNSSLK